MLSFSLLHNGGSRKPGLSVQKKSGEVVMSILPRAQKTRHPLCCVNSTSSKPILKMSRVPFATRKPQKVDQQRKSQTPKVVIYPL
jgi:hypothetical protein